MKKILLLCAVLLGAANTFAQDEDIDPAGVFVFADKDGNVYADGATVEANTVEEDEFTGDTMIPSGLYVKQTSTAIDFGVSMTMQLKSISNGSISVCFPASCRNFTSKDLGSNDLGDNKLASVAGYDSATGMAGLATEWYPTEYGQCTATFTLNTMEVIPGSGIILLPSYNLLGRSRTINVNFVYKDPTAISGVKDNTATVVERYTTGGQRISAPVKGINILKFSDGTVRKVNVR